MTTGQHMDRSSDPARFTALYQREHSAVLRFVIRRLDSANLAHAEDIAQETFTTAWRNLEAIPQNDAEARAWLFAVARNTLLNDRRATVRRTALTVRIADFDTSPFAPSHDDDVAASVDVTRAWRLLSAPEQEVLALATWEALPPDQAAKVLGVRPATYRKRLQRARAAFRKALNPDQVLTPKSQHSLAQNVTNLTASPAFLVLVMLPALLRQVLMTE